MKKILLIGWKDVKLAFRDRAALVLMLAAPFLLTLGLGFVTGHFSGSNGGISGIPVVIVNQDGAQLGNELVSAFQSGDLATLFTTTTLADPQQARQRVDDDKAAAAVIIPPGFTNGIIPAADAGTFPAHDVAAGGSQVQIELYANPTSPTSAGVVRAVLDQFINRVEVGRVGGLVAVTQLLGAGLVSPQDAPSLGEQISQRQAQQTGGPSITVNSVTAAGSQAAPFDAMATMAPGMALMFLMFTVSNGGRSLLGEQAQGTLPRLLVSPTSSSQVLAGKVVGTYLTGVIQMLILIGSSTLFFQLQWGDPLGVLVLVLAAVAGAVGWGMILTALAKTPGQVATIGSAITLTFGILGGSFFSISNLPTWLQVTSKITPNAWGMDGFNVLANGGTLAEILTPVTGLLVMSVVLFALSVFLINRRGLRQG